MFGIEAPSGYKGRARPLPRRNAQLDLEGVVRFGVIARFIGNNTLMLLPILHQ